MSPCLAEDELLDLVGGRALPASAESHLADCPECAALLGALLSTAPSEKWGALAGRRLGPYRLEAQIGAGGMGEVYRAVDERLHRAVAVKVLTHAADLARRLETEARAAAAISHRNVVTVFDVGSEGDLGYVVQELVDGESLRSVLERGPVGAARARTLALGLASGLAAAHAQGVIHRDLKPENLLVTGDGTLKILDFGLAKLAGGSALEATEPGTVQGTIGYMAPEQARGEPADARSDLFSAGAIVFELCTGRRAFAGATHAQRLAALLRDTPPVDDPALGDLAPVVARCLEREPKRRFQSAQDLAWVLERGVPAPLIQRPRLTRRDFLGVALGGAAGLAAGRLLLPSTRAPARPTFGQLTYRNGRLMSARFTPDRSMVVYGAAWDGGPLTAFAVRTDGATTRPLDLPSADVLAISRRGEVAVSLGRRHVDSQMATGRLALVPLDGGAPRTLLDDVQEADFTPDGELALVRRVGLRFRLELPAGKVVHEVDGWLTHPRVSPDGKRIAVLLHPSVGDDRGDLLVLDRAGGRPRTLASGWSSIAGLAWDPEGDRLWFTASPAAANNALYSIAPAGGDPRLVIEVPGRLRLHDIAPGGLFAMTRDAWTLRTHVGKAGAEVDRSLSDFSLLTDLSPDGETLLLGELGDVEAVNGAYLVPTAGGKSLRVGAGLPLALSPDGTRVAALVWADPPRLVVYSTTSAEQPGLGVEPIRTITFARWIDATRLVVAGAAAGRAPRLWRLDTGGGSATPLTAEGHAGRTLELDPARRRLATIDVEGRLSVVDLATGATTVVPGDFRARRVCAWLGDDAVAIRNATTPIRVTRVELAGGVATPYLDIEPPAVGLKAVDVVLLHPKSGRYAYSYGQELSQLYLVKLA